MLKKVVLVLLLVGCTLATPTTASADENYSQEAYNWINLANAFAEAGYWYSAYSFAGFGVEYAWEDYQASGDPYAYYAYEWAYFGWIYAYRAYETGDAASASYALSCLENAYEFAFLRYVDGY
jgi:hypothetical protein